MFNLVDDTRNVDVAIFGLDIGKINKEFTVCDLKIIPKFDIAGYLKGYDETTVGFIADNAVYGQFRPKSKSKLLSLSPWLMICAYYHLDCLRLAGFLQWKFLP